MSQLSHHNDGHVMPRDDQTLVRAMLKLGPNDKIPDSFLKLYWGSRNIGDRVSLGAIPDWYKVILCVVSGADVTPPPPPTIFELWRQQKIKRNTRCTIQFRGEPHDAKIESVDCARRKVIVSSSASRSTIELDPEFVELVGAAAKQKV